MGFLNSTVLDVAIGLVFVYLLLAIMCTTTNEWIAGLFKLRAKTLGSAIQQLLDDQKTNNGTAMLADFYLHPLVAGMMTPGKTGVAAHPSYLSSTTFATAVMDLVTPTKPGSISFADLESGVKSMPDGDVKTALLSLIQNANGSLDTAQKNIERWFDNTMERASGWYKRNLQMVTICTAIVLTMATNADTMRIGQVLWTGPTDRAMLANQAQNRVAGASTGSSPQQLIKPEEVRPLVDPLLGWTGVNCEDLWGWVWRLGGWLLSIIAISLGAPFWFDLLSRLMNIRNAGQKPDQVTGNGSGNPTQAKPA